MRSRDAHSPQGQWVIVTHGSFARLRFNDRNAGRFGKASQLLRGLAVEDTATGDDERPTAAPKRLDRPRQ